jgi:hypothetical protein
MSMGKHISHKREPSTRGGGIVSTAVSALTKPVGAIVNKAIDSELGDKYGYEG